MSVPPSWYLILAVALFAIGAVGALSRRGLLGVLLSVGLMVNGATLVAMTYARLAGDPTGRVLALCAIALLVAQGAVGVALCALLSRRREPLELDGLNLLRW